MRLAYLFIVVAVLIAPNAVLARQKDDADRVREAVMRSTLDQPGTHPFHLKATLAPTRERDRDSGRTGQIEIWWESPTRVRREVRSPEFHQIEVINGDHRWQKNEGGYFPNWLRQTAIALVRPIPALEDVLKKVNEADVKHTAGNVYFQWSEPSTDGQVQKVMGASVALTERTGLLFYAGSLGWGAIYDDYRKFHDRMVGWKVGVGTPEVTATITTLEDLKDVPPELFDAGAAGADANPIDTVIVDELALRKQLVSSPAITWPTVNDGPFEGTLTTSVLVDREGKIREIGPIVIDNHDLPDAARQAVGGLQFRPYVVNGVPVQVVSRITMTFKTTRPAGSENFETARTYFERGRKAGFPAADSAQRYLLRAEFEAFTSRKKVEKGTYEDTFVSGTQWRREARIGDSRCIRTRDGEKRYVLAEGGDAALLQLVLQLMEPIPATDTMYEGDWHVRRDTVNGVSAVRLHAGYVKPDGTFDANVRAYWFDEAGNLLKVHVNRLDVMRSDFQEFQGARVARTIRVLQDGHLAMKITVAEIGTAPAVSEGAFKLKGHEWQRSFTAEMR